MLVSLHLDRPSQDLQLCAFLQHLLPATAMLSMTDARVQYQSLGFSDTEDKLTLAVSCLSAAGGPGILVHLLSVSMLGVATCCRSNRQLHAGRRLAVH